MLIFSHRKAVRRKSNGRKGREMYHFFVESSNILKDQIRITGNDFNHIAHVLRMKAGEEVSVSESGTVTEYKCKIASFEEEAVILDVLSSYENDTELPAKITLFQGLPKADKMELIIQKAVELGVTDIVPVEMARSVVKLDEKKGASKTVRWQGISEAAAKQSKRGIIPNVSSPVTYKEALKLAEDYDELWIPYENAEGFAYTKKLISEFAAGESVAIIIGPEGGFEPSEIEAAKNAGGKIISLGKRILRTETAGLVILSLIMAELEK